MKRSGSRQGKLTLQEFTVLSKNWEPSIKQLAAARLVESESRELRNFPEPTGAILRAVLKRLIPQDEDIDLAAFVNATADAPLGRGDQLPGMPSGSELLRQGLIGIEEAARELYGGGFTDLAPQQQDDLLAAVAADAVPGSSWRTLPAGYFLQALYGKALHGYLSDPRVWRRIGFMGPSYPEGYVWLGRKQVGQRHARQPGWEKL